MTRLKRDMIVCAEQAKETPLRQEIHDTEA